MFNEVKGHRSDDVNDIQGREVPKFLQILAGQLHATLKLMQGMAPSLFRLGDIRAKEVAPTPNCLRDAKLRLQQAERGSLLG